MEQRRFNRIRFSAQGDLSHQGLTYPVRLENISPSGALVSAEECILIPEGDTCSLTLRLEAETPPLVLTAEVRHSFFSMVGVRFVSFEDDAECRLMETLRGDPKQPENPVRVVPESPEWPDAAYR